MDADRSRLRAASDPGIAGLSGAENELGRRSFANLAGLEVGLTYLMYGTGIRWSRSRSIVPLIRTLMFESTDEEFLLGERRLFARPRVLAPPAPAPALAPVLAAAELRALGGLTSPPSDDNSGADSVGGSLG